MKRSFIIAGLVIAVGASPVSATDGSASKDSATINSLLSKQQGRDAESHALLWVRAGTLREPEWWRFSIYELAESNTVLIILSSGEFPPSLAFAELISSNQTTAPFTWSSRQQQPIVFRSGPSKGMPDMVYAWYRVPIDNTIRQELGNQRRYQELVAESEKYQLEAVTKQIEDLTDGKLKYDMTLEQVKAILGEPRKISYPQRAGSFSVRYPNLRLSFKEGHLRDISVPKSE